MGIRNINYGDIKKKTEREIANQGCDVCPNCGESIRVDSYEVKDSLFFRRGEGIFLSVDNAYKGDYMHYVCRNCGVKWDSDYYNVRADR